MRRPELLCVDDNPGFREFYEALFGSRNYDVVSETDGLQALKTMYDNPDRFSAVIIEFDLPGMTGPELAENVKLLWPELPVIIISALSPW